MTWHPTNTEAAIGLIGAAIGGVLIVCASLRNNYGKPAKRPKCTCLALELIAFNDCARHFPPLEQQPFTGTEDRASLPLLRESGLPHPEPPPPPKPAVTGMSNRKRDKNGRLHGPDGGFLPNPKS
jgi:hypothetical protein